MRKLNKYSDIISGILLLITSCLIFISSQFILQRTSISGIGPKFMPQLVSVILAIVSILIVISGIKKNDTQEEEQGDFPVEKKIIVAVVQTILLIILYVALLSILGFVISTAIYLFLQFIVLDIGWRAKILKFLLLAILSSILIYLVFRHVFTLILPSGMLF